MEVGVVEPRIDVGDASVAEAERIVVVAAALDQLADVPFEVGGGGGAVLDLHEAVGAEGGDHEEARSTIGSLETNWLMVQVPAMIEASPAPTTPEPSALATTSKSRRPPACPRRARSRPRPRRSPSGDLGRVDQ